MAWKSPPRQRSYSCNPELLVFLRESREWTQKELAQKSGYSERLIIKSEAGQPISAAAIAIIAESLHTVDQPVYPEDLVSDPVSLAQEYMAAMYTAGKDVVERIRHFLDEDIVVRIAGNPADIPFAGEHRGIDAMAHAFEIFFSILEAPADHDYHSCYTFMGQGNEVRMFGESWIHPIGQPLEKPIPISHRYVFRRGKLILIEDIFDTQAGAKALRGE